MNFKRLAKVACTAAVAGVLAVGLAACSSSTSSYTTNANNTYVKVGVTKDYHEDIVKAAAELGVYDNYDITVEVVEYSTADDALNALNNGELDAAYVTDVFRLNAFNAEHNTDLTEKCTMTFGRMGAYSKKYKSLSELPDGATVAIANTDQEFSRGLNLLATEKLITISSSANPLSATEKDVTANTKNLQFVKVDFDQLVAGLDKYDVVLIPYDDAIAGGLQFSQAIASETASSSFGGYFSDVVAVTNAGDATDKTDKLMKSLQDAVTSNAITSKYTSKEIVLAYGEQMYRTDHVEFERY